jgi:hypothetical protein
LTLVPVLSLTAGALLMPLLSRFIDSFGSGIGLPIMIVGAAVIDIPESVQSVWNTYSIGQTTRILIACSLAIAVLMVVGAVAFFRWWTINRADSGTLFFNSILLAAVTSGWLLPLASFLFEPETLQFQGHAEVLAWYVPYALLSVIFLFVILPPQNFLMISAISAASLYLILEAFVDVLVPEFFTFTLLEVCALGLLVAAFMLAQHDTKITRGTANAFRKTLV